MKSNYLKNVYSNDRRPKSNYPDKLVNYLISTHKLQKGKILDLGCGRGELLDAFHKAGFDVYGSDLDNDAIDLCKPHRVEISNFEEGKINYNDNFFDYVISKSVIEHLHDPLPILNDVNRVLKKDGKAIMLTPSWEHTKWGPFYLDFTHRTPFTIPSLKDLLTLSGFKEVRAKYLYQLPYLWKYPYLTFISKFIGLLPIRYSPMNEKKFINDSFNKFVRFSTEAMILGVGKK